MAATAISGFIDGYFKGRDIRDRKEDRETAKERQKRLDQINEERHGVYMDQADTQATYGADQNRRANEAHGARMDEYADSQAERERQRARQQEERDFWKSMPAMGAQPNYGGARQSDFPIGEPANQQQPQTQPSVIPAQPKLGYSANPGNQIVSGSGADNQMAGGLVVMPKGAEDRLDGESASPQAQISEVDPNASAFRQDAQGLRRKRDVGKVLSRISTSMAHSSSPVASGFGAVKDYFTATPAEGRENAQQRAAKKEARNWYASQDAQEFFEANPDLLGPAQQDPVGFFASKDGETPDELKAFVSNALSPQGSQGQPASPSPSPQQGTPVQQRESAAAVSAAERTALSFGLRPGERVTKSQRDRGSKAYIDQYMETVVPAAVDFYTKRGEIDKATGFLELIESHEGKQIMRDNAQAAVSLSIGDIDDAAGHLLSAQKRAGTIDPSIEIDEEATGFIRDGNGAAVGGRIVYVDKETGNRFEKTFASSDELIQYGIMTSSPVMLAEQLFSRKPQAQPKGQITQQDIMKGAVDLMKSDITGEMTMDQAMQQMMRGLGALGASAGGGAQQPPDAPLYRPNQ